MKRYIVFVLALCCLLSGCATVSQQAAPSATAEPQATTQPVATPEPGPMLVLPLPQTIDLSDQSDSILAVSLKEGDVYVNENNELKMKVNIYAYELYDAVDMSLLKVGDSIRILGQDVAVSSLDRAENGDIVINGGLDVGGHVFRSEGGGVYYEIGYNDAKSYALGAEAVLPVSDQFSFVDKSDLDNEPQIYYADDFFVEGRFGWYFFPSNTKIHLENGVVVSMERVYIP